MPVFALYVTYPRTGHTTVMTFSTAHARALHVISWRLAPVVMRIHDYHLAA